MSHYYPRVKSSLLLITFLALTSCFGFIYDRMDCERFNIDHIELRTGINIPAITHADCEFNESGDTRTATFVIDTLKVNMQSYISDNGFRGIDFNDYEIEKRLNSLPDSIMKMRADLLVASMLTDQHTWTVILDPGSGFLRVWINYYNTDS